MGKHIDELVDGVQPETDDLIEVARLSGSRYVSRRLPLSSAGGTGIISVKSFGAKGDNSTDDTAAIQAAIDYCFGSPGSPNNGNAYLNYELFFPAGRYIITDALVFPPIRGAHIFGAGRFATQILQQTLDESVFITDGMEYSYMHGLYLFGSGHARLLDLNWDGSSGAGGAALQSNTFFDMYFKGGAYGIDIGRGGFMGSENTFIQCFFDTQNTAGLKTSNFNALQNQIIGGDFQVCEIGVYVQSGSVPVIQNCGFQQSNTCDIKIDNSSDNEDTMTIIGCRTESDNFISTQNNALPINIIGVDSTSTANGVFVNAGAQAVYQIIGCGVKSGQLSGTDPHFYVLGSKFDRSAFLNVGMFSSSDAVTIIASTMGGTAIRHRQYYVDAVNGGSYSFDWQQRPVFNATSAKTLPTSQSGNVFTNAGATSRVDYTLPGAAANLTFTFYCADTDGIRVIAAAGDDIRIAASVSAAAGRIDSTTIGDSVTLVAIDATHWVAVASVGAGWTVT